MGHKKHPKNDWIAHSLTDGTQICVSLPNAEETYFQTDVFVFHIHYIATLMIHQQPYLILNHIGFCTIRPSPRRHIFGTIASGNDVYSLPLNMAIEIVDVPIKHAGSFQSVYRKRSPEGKRTHN